MHPPDRYEAVIRGLFSRGIAVAAVTPDMPNPSAARLWPGEEAAVTGARPSRRAEFATGRMCARRAMERLGVPPTAIPVAQDRSPIWPPGIVGTITHCARLTAAAVGHRSNADGLGLDAEPDQRLETEEVRIICSRDENAWLRAHAADAVNWPLAIFCAKEALHKAVHPVTRVMLDFHDVSVTFDAFLVRFSLLSSKDRDIQQTVARVQGRIAFTEGLVLAAAVLPVLRS